MPRFSPRVLATCAALALFTAFAAADEPKAYDLARQDEFQVGDTRTIRTKEVETQRLTTAMEDGSPAGVNAAPEKTTTVEYVEKVVAVDDKGRPTKVRVRVVRWAVQQGEESEEGLEGVLLELTGRARERTWALVDPETAVSVAAREWLEEEFTGDSDEDAVQAALLPKKPIAVGETWNADLAAMVGAGLGDKVTVDLEKSSGVGTFESIDGETARLSWNIAFTVTAAGGAPLEKGEIKVKASQPQALQARVLEGTGRTDLAMSFSEAFDEDGKKGVRTLERTSVKDETRKNGGEVPDPK